MKNVYVVRHCKAEGQSADARLTDFGVQQAYYLAEFFIDKHIDHIISSPYERAYRTITPLADHLGLEIVMDDRLTERVLSAENHLEWRDMLHRTYDDVDLCYEGGESSRTAMSRIVAVVMEVLNSRYNHIVIVSHGNLISLLLKHFDDRIGFSEWEALSNPDVYQLSYVNDISRIQRTWED
ncbi:putative phosphoserine phosphatase 2 [compost metagenome]